MPLAPAPAESGPRRSGRVTGKQARLANEQVLLAQGTTTFVKQEPYDDQGCAFAAVAGDTPKSYDDIANFGDMARVWYDSYRRDRANMYNMKVLSDIKETDE